jgi:hypothetical protein
VCLKHQVQATIYLSRFRQSAEHQGKPSYAYIHIQYTYMHAYIHTYISTVETCRRPSVDSRHQHSGRRDGKQRRCGRVGDPVLYMRRIRSHPVRSACVVHKELFDEEWLFLSRDVMSLSLVPVKQYVFKLTRPEIEGGPRRRFGWILQFSKRQNPETAWQNGFVDHLRFLARQTQTQFAL